MARDIFPHDRFEDTLYSNAVGVYGEQAKSDEKLKKLLLDGVAKLDADANKKFKKPYAQVEKETDRLTILKAMEKSEFFGKLRGDLVVSLYNQPAVWAKLGYQGPSADKGGYINRGFNDQTWMDRA
ncbi:MAG: gluconate 2-dehydrogenase subunit 3 family protein [Oxalobacteraceae bacterium]|nr:gluconate 2-dehydrogenase subunit 3 family protein [Oxalobacteraceae bacterium]